MDIRIAHVFINKNPRVRKTETVNGLFHVSHHKKVTPAAGHGFKDELLDGVHVLIFVYHYFRIFLAELYRQPGRGATLPVHQQPYCQVLQIGEIQKAKPALFPGIRGVKIQGETQQGLHGRTGFFHVPYKLWRFIGKKLGKSLHILFAGIAPGFDMLLQYLILKISQAVKSGKGYGQVFRRFIPFPLQGTA